MILPNTQITSQIKCMLMFLCSYTISFACKTSCKPFEINNLRYKPYKKGASHRVLFIWEYNYFCNHTHFVITLQVANSCSLASESHMREGCLYSADWNGPLDYYWNTGMDYWNTGMDYWNMPITSLKCHTHSYTAKG